MKTIATHIYRDIIKGHPNIPLSQYGQHQGGQEVFPYQEKQTSSQHKPKTTVYKTPVAF